MRSVGSHSTSGREKEGNEERTGYGIALINSLRVRIILITHFSTVVLFTSCVFAPVIYGWPLKEVGRPKLKCEDDLFQVRYPRYLPESVLFFLPSFSLPGVLCDTTDLIWMQGIPFETKKVAQQSSNGLQVEVSWSFPQS